MHLSHEVKGWFNYQRSAFLGMLHKLEVKSKFINGGSLHKANFD